MLHLRKWIVVVILLLVVAVAASAQKNPSTTIQSLLQQQAAAWNRGDIESFMSIAYWNNDSLMFIGSKGITYGYAATLANYKTGYPDTASMGKLRFDILQIKPLNKNCYFVVGKWYLQRSKGNVGGHFTLIWRYINQRWVIVADHSS
jgi:ketosteroid isomerase-like protein